MPQKHHAVVVLALPVLLLVAACRPANTLPLKATKEYNDAVATFYVGLAALQVGDDIRADAQLAKLTQLVPAEPAGWGNWGVLALRQRNYEVAAERLEHTRSLAPENDQVEYLIGLLESNRGRSDEAISALQKAVKLNPKNLIATYKLAEETERLNSDSSLAEVQVLLQKLLDVQPDNLAVLIEVARVAAKRGDTQTLQTAVDKLSARAQGWPKEVQQPLSNVQSAVQGSDSGSAAIRITFLRNVLVRVPEYRQDLAWIKPPPGEEAQPFTSFVRLESPTFEPAVADAEISFNPEPVPDIAAGKWTWIGALQLDSESPPALTLGNGLEVLIGEAKYAFPGGPSATQPSRRGIAAFDFNYDFKNDLVFAGSGGLRLLKQEANGKFVDVTSETKLSPDVLSASYLGTWPADIDADGDLDIVLGAANNSPTVLRNNGDGSFGELHPFDGVSGLREFVWADIDGDGDPDAALVDNNTSSQDGHHLHIFTNERSGQFQKRNLPASLTTIRTINVADVDQNGVMDLLVVQDDGVVLSLSDNNEGGAWSTGQVAHFDDLSRYARRDFYLDVLDLDNNGANDLLLTFNNNPQDEKVPGAFIWLGSKDNKFNLIQNSNLANTDPVFASADLNGDGRLDLLSISQTGEVTRRINRGTKDYHWQVIRPRAAKAVGDQRINSFGIGGEMEIRAGLLVQKQLVTGPIVHFGLGNQTNGDVVRIVWPNGSVRAEFETKADQAIVAEQRLKGSCPFLFAYDGKEMKFVKDTVPWGSAIGLRINTLGTAKVEATEEWYKIRGDQLAPKDGYYDLRITAELWETYYYDQLDLMVVDHPVGTDVFVDERFVIPPAKLAVTTVATPKNIKQAFDDTGKDVTETVSKLDEKYLDTFGRGRYQGVTRDHYVEVDLGDNISIDKPIYLIAHGWMHPTDSSINVAISQGNNASAKPLSLEVPDGKGGWVVARANLGFPAGRKKISLIDLNGLFRPGIPHRIRLRTTLEIYWDCFEWAEARPETELKSVRLNPATADLHFRGFSLMTQVDESSPQLPDYNKLSSSKQIWRDLVGYYTRFGDVRELLERVDDRYVIMNAGDEMTFRFAAPPPPGSGWIRDFVIIGDGWIKDGDYNSTFSKTVLPLPYHAKHEYTEAPTVLEEEFVYKKYPTDWQTYHTRYVTPDVFRNALRQNSK